MSSNPTRVILLSCGSFNPINYMHLRMFELARDFLNATGKYRIIGGIVSPVSDAYGKKSLAPSNHRSAMVRLALQTSTWVRLDSWESDQPKWIDTATLLRHHRDVVEMTLNLNQLDPYTPTRKRRHVAEEDGKQLSTEADMYPTSTQSRAQGSVEVMFLCGADVIESFAVPGLWKTKDIEEIVSQFGLVVITRMGFHPERLVYESDVLTKYKNNIHVVPDWVPNDMCSARIRMAIRRRQSARYLVPEAVLEYIDRHNLYSTLPPSSSAASTYDDLASPPATAETSTSGDAMQESSYSVPSHYGYPSTSRIVDTHGRSYYHHHQMCCRALYPLVPSQSLEGPGRFPHQQMPLQHQAHHQHHHHQANFVRKRGVSTPRSLVYGVNQGTGISKQSFGRSKSLDIDSRSRGSGYSTLAGGPAAPGVAPSAPRPQFPGQQQQQYGYARRAAPAVPHHHHKNLNLDEEQRHKCRRENSSDSIFGKFAKTVRSESKDQTKQQQQQQQQQHQKAKQHYVAPHAAATLQQQKQLQQQYPQLFQSEDIKERSGSIVSAADLRGLPVGTKGHHRKNFSLDSELDRQAGRRGSRILAPPARHQSSERAASVARSVKGVRLTPETCV